MKLTVNDLSKLIGVSELTITRWVRQGKIPFHEVGRKYYFDRKAIERWAYKRNIFLHRDISQKAASENTEDTGILESMKRGGVFFDVKGSCVEDVLRNIVFLAPLSDDVDRDFLFDMLIQREKLASTGIGYGVAIPHLRYPMKGLFELPTITVCFLEKKIDFNSVDGKPVFVVFLILSNSTKSHLKLLSQLNFCLRDSAFMSFLQHCNDKEEFLGKVEEMEKLFD